ncbi:methyltransferase, FkbM family [Leptolyngbya sp. PCC 7375]|nr:methyltransferase, FkbM family [Leptolyngbya sp. PCC 7375]
MIIVDIGANDGSFFAIPKAKDSNNLVYAVEPNRELASKIENEGFSNLHVFCTFFGEVDADSVGGIEHSQSSSSATKALAEESLPNHITSQKNEKTDDKTNVSVTRLDTFCIANNIAEIDFLKIDTQGYELQVLKGAGEKISCIKRILLEVQLQPLYENAGTKEEIIDYLTNRGFRLVIAQPQTQGLEENLEFVRVNRFPLYKTSESFIVSVPHVGIIQTPPNDYVGHLLEQGVFEGIEQAFVWLYLRPGDTFLDCGAHVGLFSCIAAKRLKHQGAIIGFEPNPICLDFYQRNLQALGCEIFTAVPVGLSDQTGSAEFSVGKQGMSAFGTFTPSEAEQTIDKQLVSLDTLDNLMGQLAIDHVAFAKLDVEGWENFVLKGAINSIQRQKFPLWMIEFTEENAAAADSSTQKLRVLIESFGYTLCRFDTHSFRLVPEPHQLTYTYRNLFAVLDLESINKRLATADHESCRIARDIISRSDTADIASMGLNLINEKYQQFLAWQQTNDALEQTIKELQNTQQRSEETHQQLQHTQNQAQQTQDQLQQTQDQLQQTQEQLHQAYTLLHQTQKSVLHKLADRIVHSHIRRHFNQYTIRHAIKQVLPNSVVAAIKDIKNQYNKLTLDERQIPAAINLPNHYQHTPLTAAKPPKISIVTPSYNQAEYIELTIKSVVEQNYPDLEYFIQDGASSDGTQEVLHSYAHRITKIISEPDNGQANAINRGFAHSSGEIMAWLNSDDLLLPGSLNYVASYFNSHPEVDVVYGHRIIVNEHNQQTSQWVLPPHSDSMLTWADYVPQETMFWRRAIWDRAGGCVDESFRFALDWDLILRFREAGANFVRLPRFLGAFRVYPQQKTSAWNEVGQAEMELLRKRCHHRTVTQEEVNEGIRPYHKKAWRYHWLHSLSLLNH